MTMKYSVESILPKIWLFSDSWLEDVLPNLRELSPTSSRANFFVSNSPGGKEIRRSNLTRPRPVNHFSNAHADRTRFGLNADQWLAFLAALDAPPRELPRLNSCFRSRASSKFARPSE